MPRQPQLSPHRYPGSGPLRIALAALPAAVMVLASTTPPRAEPQAPSTLRVASIDLTDAPGLAPPKKPAPARPAWRTTFGSERTVEPKEAAKAKPPSGAIDADAVLLQGVADPSVLPRLFPARYWRLVVSREVFLSDKSGIAVTAIAVRVRPGLRLTAREHLLDLADAAPPAKQKKKKTAPITADAMSLPAKPNPAPAAAKSKAPAPPAETSQARASATAVRIVERGRVTWLLSAALPDPCGAADTSCAAQTRLTAWRKEKLAAAETVVAGGHLGNRAGKPCAEQAVEADLQTLSQSRQLGQPFTGGGCLAVLELSR